MRIQDLESSFADARRDEEVRDVLRRPWLERPNVHVGDRFSTSCALNALRGEKALVLALLRSLATQTPSTRTNLC